MLLDMLNDLAEAMNALDGKKKSTEQEGKDCNDQDKQAQELVLGSFLAPEIEMIFGDGVGVSLFEMLAGFLYWNSAAEEGAWVGLKADLKEAHSIC